MDFLQKKIFVRISYLYGSFGKLNLTDEQLNCLYRECAEMAYSLGDKPTQAMVCVALGDVNITLSQFNEAIKYYETSLKIAKEFGNKANEGAINGELGNCYLSLGQFKKAVQHYKECLDIAKAVGDKQVEGASYGNLGICYRYLGQYNKAIQHHQRHSEIAKESRDLAGQGGAISNLANCYFCLGQFKEAICHHEMFLKISMEIKDIAGEGTACGNLGNCYHSLGMYNKALEHYKKHLNIAKQTARKRDEGAAYGNIGTCYHSLGEYEKAVHYNQMHLNIAKQIGDKASEGRAYGNLGICCHSHGEYEKGILYYQLQLEITKQIGDKSSEEAAYGNLGNCYYSLGKLEKAIQHYQMQLDISKQIGDKLAEGTVYGNLGNSFHSLGQYDKAAYCYEKQLNITKQIGDKAGEGRAYGNLGICYSLQGELENAIHNHKMHLEIVRETGDQSVEGEIYGNLGNCYLFLGQNNKAIQHQEMCLTIAKQIGNKALEGSASGDLGGCYYSLGEYNKAIPYYETHLNIAKQTRNKASEGHAYGSLGTCYYVLGRYDNAKQKLRESLQCYEELFENVPKQDQFKTSVRDTFIRYYRILAGSLLSQSKTEQALVVAEKGRARALAELIRSRYSVNCAEVAEANILDLRGIQEVVKGVGTAVMFLSLDFHGINIWVIQPNGIIEFKAKHIKTSPKFKKRGFLTDRATLVEEELNSLICNARGPRAIESTAKYEDRSLSFLYAENAPELKRNVSTPTQSRNPKSHEMPFQEQNSTQTSSASMSASPSEDKKQNTEGLTDETENTSPLRELYKIVLGPVVQFVKGSNIVVAADGLLNLIPFAALIDEEGHYLAKTLQVRLIPSIATAKMIMERPQKTKNQGMALVVGDPDAGTKSRLPGAAAEARVVAALLNAQPLTGKMATKEQVLQHLENSDLIHIAAHGDMKTGEILLADPIPGVKSSKRNSMLMMSDLENKRLTARLVVLSCCHSARGEIKAEGVIGIARAFIGAGARSVLVALWAIKDEATLFFMKKYYEHLTRGERANASLNKAMAAMREKVEFRDPLDWAPFVLIGDDVTIC